MARVTEEDLRHDLENKNAMLDRIAEAAKPYGTVVFVGATGDGRKKAVVKTGDGMMEVNHALGVGLGDTVSLHGMTRQIVDVGVFKPMGGISSVTKIINENLLEVEGHGGPRIVVGDVEELKIEEGCRVALDATDSVIVVNLGKPAGEFSRGETGVTWDDIGGLVDAKRMLIEAVETPHRFPELHKLYRQSAPKGIALEGPPGCGKTMLGKAAATAIAKLHGADVKKGLGSGFMYVKGPEVLSKWVGEAEQEIRAIFSRARSHMKTTGYPAVVFLDEAESLLSKRGSGVSSDMEKTIVPTFLAEMDGLDASSAIVIIATNRVDRIDPAVLRDGRIDWKVRVSRPSQQDVADIIEMNLSDRPLARNAPLKEVAEYAAAQLFDDERIVSVHEKKQKRINLSLADMMTGAMAANLVSLATRSAVRRDVADRVKKPSGINASDIVAAADELTKMNRFIDHSDVLAEVLEKHQETHQQPMTAAATAAA